MKTLSWDDSNAYRWTAQRADGASMFTITVEKDAPYKTRTLKAPQSMTDAELRAFVEASVAIAERAAATAAKKPTKKPTPAPPPNVPTMPSLPDRPAKSGGGIGVVVLVLLGLYALSKKGR